MRMATGERDLLQLLANPTNRTILSVLSLEPQYPRRLADLVGLTEDEASRRLRAFEKLGLAEGSWANVGRNVRLYRLATSKFTVTVGPDGLSVTGVAGEKRVTAGPTAEMPPSLERFVGREDELAALEALLAQRRATAVVGIGGAGKTALAAAYAKRSGRPVAWHTLATGESDVLLLARLATNLHAIDTTGRGARLVALRDAEDPAVLLGASLESANALGALLVLDRLEGMGDGAVEAVTDLARGLTSARLLLTSRTFPQGLPRDLVATYRAPGLIRHDAERLLHAFGARVDTDALDEILDRTHGHPLSLVLVSQVADEARAGRAERLIQESGIRNFLVDDVIPQLSEPERDLLFALSVLRQPFLADEAEALSGSKHATTTLLRLENRGLVVRAGDTFLLHDLVRSFAADAAPQRKLLHGRAAKVLQASGEATKVLEAIHHSIEAGAVAEAGALVREEAARRPYRFADLGPTATYREVLERLIAHEKTDPAARTAAATELAVLAVYAGEGDTARAHLDSVRSFAERDTGLVVPWLLARARLHRLEGDYAESARLYAETAERAERAQDVAHEVLALVDWAFMEEERDDEAAFKLYTRAAERVRPTSDLRSLSLALSGAARIKLRGGDDRYLPMAQEALHLARMTGYLRGEVSVYMTLTTHALIQGQTQAGLEYSDRYVTIANRLGDPWLLACALNDKAILLVGVHRYDEALALATEAIRHARQIRSVFFEFGGHLCAAEALLGLGRAREARERLLPALGLKLDAWPAFTARGWKTMAAIHTALGETKEARAALAEYRAVAGRLGTSNIAKDAGAWPGAGRVSIEAEPERPKATKAVPRAKTPRGRRR